MAKCEIVLLFDVELRHWALAMLEQLQLFQDTNHIAALRSLTQVPNLLSMPWATASEVCQLHAIEALSHGMQVLCTLCSSHSS